MNITTFVLPPLDTNCFGVTDDNSNDAIIIDPGVLTGELLEFAEAPGRTVLAILNTHGHIDHIAGNAQLRRITKAPIYIHADDAPLLENATMNGAHWVGMDYEPHRPDHALQHGETLTLGSFKIKVLHCPGHANGQVAFLIENHFFCGDFIFKGSIGRVDLPGGNPRVMADSVEKVFLPLDDDIIIHPGHGPDTTVGEEKQSNFFVQRLLDGEMI
jgi:hydroxyacylglutathione hydrolase